MSKLTVNSDVVECYRLLPAILENALKLIKASDLSTDYFTDICFMMSEINWMYSSNDKKLSVNKFAVNTDSTWGEVLNQLGILAIAPNEVNAGLPRVQQERLILDALAYSVFSLSDTEVKQNIEEVFKHQGISFIQFAVETNKKSYLSIPECITSATEDVQEVNLMDRFKFWVEFTNLCNGEVDSLAESMDEDAQEVDLTDDDIKEVLEYYNKYADTELVLPEKTGIPKDLIRLCKFIVNTHPVVLLTVKAAKIVKDNFFKSFDKMLVDNIAESDSLSMRMRLLDLAEVLKESGKEYTIYWTEEMKEGLYLASTDLFEVLVTIFGGSQGTVKTIKNGAKILTAVLLAPDEEVDNVVAELE